MDQKNLHANQMFRTTADEKDEGFDPVEIFKPQVIHYWPFQGGSSVVVHKCCMLLRHHVYGL